MSRLTLSDDDKKVRDWFVETTKSLGCKVTVDAMGNIFAIRPGRLDGPPTLVGSHLDTQPTGGRYDGILGVQAGIEMLKILQEHDVETEFPVGVVNWTKYVFSCGIGRPFLNTDAPQRGRRQVPYQHDVLGRLGGKDSRGSCSFHEGGRWACNCQV